MFAMIGAGLLALASASPLPAAMPQTDCKHQPAYLHTLSIEPGPARQGATLKIAAVQRIPGPGGDEADPCARDWRISNPKAVKLAKDRKSLTIAADAPAGGTVTISYATANGKRVQTVLRIVARDAVVLTGTRGQKALENCSGETVRELEFSEGNRFAVTYQPFETYRDYWGSYAFDPASGALTLSVTGGNRIPGDLDLTGTARFDDAGRLVLEGFNLGLARPDDQPAKPCRYIF